MYLKNQIHESLTYLLAQQFKWFLSTAVNRPFFSVCLSFKTFFEMHRLNDICFFFFFCVVSGSIYLFFFFNKITRKCISLFSNCFFKSIYSCLILIRLKPDRLLSNCLVTIYNCYKVSVPYSGQGFNAVQVMIEQCRVLKNIFNLIF